MKKIFRNLSHVQIIALGFAGLILIGTLLLMLPIATQGEKAASFSDALFTATSASCVTGLVTVDTGTTWSFFGQAVILILIQIGGLGFMTIATFFFMLFRKKMGLRQKEVMGESINASRIGGMRKLAGHILIGTALVELSGALILFLRYFISYHYPLPKALWHGTFHAISAFCNAGFDINGNFSSQTAFSSDPLVLVVLMILIVLGGLGFFVWEELLVHRFRFRRYSLHAKIVLVSTALLILLPSILFFITEESASHAGMSFGDAILASLFDSISPRTAGMNVTSTASLSPAGSLLTMALMFIGGSPSSTAGGIKTTTLAVMLLFALSSVRKSRYAGAFGRRLPEQCVPKALSVFFINLLLLFFGFCVIAIVQPALSFRDILFEVFSAIGTVGMTMGITPSLAPVSRAVIILLMFCGRIGSIAFGSALIEKKAPPPVLPPAESITIG